MPQSSHYDNENGRLPDGMSRVGYDADTQIYTFRDSDGSYWESAPGCEYGLLTQVGSVSSHEDAGDTEPFLLNGASTQKTSWRHELMPLLNFGVLIGLSLLLLFWFLHRSAASDMDTGYVVSCAGRSVTVQKDDTCWGLAKNGGISVDDLLGENLGLDCKKLSIGSTICLPAEKPVSKST